MAVGKPVVLVLFSGRPLVLNWAAAHTPAIVEAWFPGTEAGSAIANVLFGDTNPSGKLPVSFPRAVGQEPLYLSELPTGRPAAGANLSYPPANDSEKFYSRYIDVPNSPLYPFGHGLSYTSFEYSDLHLNLESLRLAQLKPASHGSAPRTPVEATITVRNSGTKSGTEIIQLYIRIRGVSVEQPVRALKGFKRIVLERGQAETVKFTLGWNELSFVNSTGNWTIEPAEYTIYIGGSSKPKRMRSSTLFDKSCGISQAER